MLLDYELLWQQIVLLSLLPRLLVSLLLLLDFEKIYVYETMIGGSRMYSVMYNDFGSRQTARSILENLPEDMRASKPFLRRVSALRKDLEANG